MLVNGFGGERFNPSQPREIITQILHWFSFARDFNHISEFWDLC
jgi:hypothetical protein